VRVIPSQEIRAKIPSPGWERVRVRGIKDRFLENPVFLETDLCAGFG
jgi:hypothetical protein